MQLYTQHNFTVVRQIGNHTDVNTYYVQAVIRNAYTDEIIATLNLTSKGSQRFKKDWQVPADPSGEGFYISIITSVYTDSNYTTKSDDYADEENTYQVIDKPRIHNGTSAGGGGSLGRRDVRDIMSEELQKVLPQITPKEVEPIEPPEPTDYTDHFKQIMHAIANIEKPEAPEKVDFSPVLDAIASLAQSVGAIEMPELDLSPVLSKLDEIENDNILDKEEFTKMMQDVVDNLKTDFETSIENVLKKISLVTSSVTFVGGKGLPALHKALQNSDEVGSGEESKIDLKKLST